MNSPKNLSQIAKDIRKDILHISYTSKVGHIGSAFSIVEILVALYFKILKINKKLLNSPSRDRFILSKGHASPALYAVLFKKGIISKGLFDSYCQNGGSLEEHPSYLTRGVEWSTGSLGHGLSIGLGMALAAKIQKLNFRVFVLSSDAECDEGETWEAALSSAHFRLNNLILLLDYNKVQAMGKIKDVLNLEPLKDKWRSFNWNVLEVDGHDAGKITKTIKSAFRSVAPTIIICRTVRGHGVSFMRHVTKWHYLSLTLEHYKKAIMEIAS